MYKDVSYHSRNVFSYYKSESKICQKDVCFSSKNLSKCLKMYLFLSMFLRCCKMCKNMLYHLTKLYFNASYMKSMFVM